MKRKPTKLAGIGVAILGIAGTATLPAQTQAQSQAQTSEVEVVGRRQSGAYLADQASGTKTDLPLREVPQAVRVISGQTLSDLGANRVDDVLDYVGGVSRQNSFGGLWDNIAIRGMAGDINSGMPLLLNGFSGNRGFNAPRDTANLERIEFLKGPVASLYGTSEPGGTLNLVTKLPLWKPAYSIEAYAGSYQSYRTTLDATGPLGADVAYRLNAAIENKGSFRDYINSKRTFLAPALTWKISPATRLDYSGEFLEHKTPLDRGVVAINNQLGLIPRERFLGEPADGDITVKNQTHQVRLEHIINEQWSSRLGVSYKNGTLNGFSTEAQSALLADGQTLRRQRRFRDYASNDLSFQAEAVGKFKTGDANHELLIGAQTYRFELDQVMLRINPTAASPYAINVLNPVYGQLQPTPLANTSTLEKQENVAFYLQDTVSIGQWRILGGLRFDRYDQTLSNRLKNTVAVQSQSAVSPRIGVSYLLSPQFTLFANLGRSFRPNSGVDAAGGSFKPESGKATEAGLKWENSSRSMGASVALFDIRKTNALTADPSNAGFSIAAGQIQSRGIDADLSGQINSAWRINASLSYIDANVVRDNTLEVGGRLLNIPKINGSVLLVRETPLESGGRFGIGGGFTFSGARLGEARTQAQAKAGTPAFDLPSYSIAKAVAYWRINPTLRVSLDIDNLFNKTYYTNSFQSTWVAPGSPRTVTLGLQAKF